MICDDDLQDKTPEDEGEPAGGGGPGEMALSENLGEEMAGTLDGAGDELREEGDEDSVVIESAAGGHVAAIDVDDVAHALEGVKGDASGDDEAEDFWRGGQTKAGERTLDIFDKEAAVFEPAEQAQIGYHAEAEP